MKDEFIEYGSDIHPVESEFFKELMLLCAKYGVKLKPNVFTAASKEESRAECNGEETADYPAIEFEFRESSFINNNFDIDASLDELLEVGNSSFLNHEIIKSNNNQIKITNNMNYIIIVIIIDFDL